MAKRKLRVPSSRPDLRTSRTRACGTSEETTMQFTEGNPPLEEGARGRGVIDAIQTWNLRKQMFSEAQIELAAKRLNDEGGVVQA